MGLTSTAEKQSIAKFQTQKPEQQPRTTTD